ncbi:ribosomal protein S20 (plastid) [Cryptomonas paramecium]|uniref:Ribosomal protein S20 n=1 Tax=Cryptomonas paramaecium TaxID=2898 RepID=D2IS81_9CRYP|nr:ribosomal protein S20 [Cryptomonas paramecium]ACT46773.1 ribosomal protein S20 [Cryptomonas paramecium]BDA98022.1 ribosomal protein S20 [Cryptomonas paramecium]
MPNLKSSCKRALLSEKRRLRNKNYLSTVSTLMKKTLLAMLEKDEKTISNLISITYSKIDKAVQKGIIQLNKGNSKKSKLAIELKNTRQPQTIHQKTLN